jgi:replicative DNA helicase
MNDELKPPPHSRNQEMSILSSMLKDPVEFIPRAIELGISPVTFYIPTHRDFCDLLMSRHNHGKPIELITIVEEMMKNGLFERMGGTPAGVTQIFQYAPTNAHFDEHAKNILHLATFRRIIKFCEEMIGKAYEGESIGDLLSQLELGSLNIGQESEANTAYDYTLKAAMAELMREFEAGGTAGIKTGFTQLDNLIGGLHPGDVTVVAARPGTGKTSFAISLADSIAVRQGMPTALFVVEGSRNYLTTRLMASMTQISAKSLRDGKFRNDDIEKLRRAVTQNQNKPLMMDSRVSNAVEIAAKIRRIHQQTPLKVVIIDYIQKLPGAMPEERANHRLKIKNATSILHETCKSLGIALVLLAQLRRDSAKDNPAIEALMESASLEEDGDTVILIGEVPLKTGEKERDKDQTHPKLIRVAKNRHGPCDDIWLNFNPKTTQFF